jgi:hypothetical protein
MLHGALVGVVATLLYVALTLAWPGPFSYLAAHGLKILEGAEVVSSWVGDERQLQRQGNEWSASVYLSLVRTALPI